MQIARIVSTALLTLVLRIGIARQSSAAVVGWDGAAGPWNEPTNWQNDILPGNDEAHIDNGGTATISDGEVVNTGFAVLGATTGTRGTLQMNGGKLNTNFDIRVGGNSTTGGGTGLFQHAGGDVFMNGGNVNVGFGTTGVGTLANSGGTFVVNSGAIFAVGNRGVGTVDQTGGTIYVRGASDIPGTAVQLGRNTATVGGSGTYNLSGGTLAANGLDFGNVVGPAGSTNVFNLQGSGRLLVNQISIKNIAASNSFNFTGGTLSASGIGMSLVNDGGNMNPSTTLFGAAAEANGLPPLVTEIGSTVFVPNTSYTQNVTGRLSIDIADPETYDLMNVGGAAGSGTASLAGTIAVNLLNSFDPAIGSFFDVVFAETVNNTAVVTGQTPSGSFFTPSIVSTADGNLQALRLTVVPEPTSWAFLGAAAVAIGFQSRTRRQRSL